MKYYDKSLNTRGIRNNNPFNIVKSRSNWLGKLYPSRDKAFETFENMEYGVRAGVVLLRNYIRKCRDTCTHQPINTVSRIIYRFAPSHENDSEEYINFIVRNIAFFKGSDFTRDTPIVYPSIEFCSLCQLIMEYESKYFVPLEHIYYIINKFKLY